MKEIGVGIIGYGFMGKAHSYSYKNLPLFFDPPPARIRLAGVCTSRKETAEKAREIGGFEFATTDVRELLDNPEIDVINCCTPNHLHYDLLLQAMEAGKHIYCDKPLTRTVEEARKVAALSREWTARGKKHQVALQYRFLPAILRAKQLVQEGFLGRVYQFRAEYLHSGYIDPKRPMSWRLNFEKSGGGALFDLGSHVLDLIYYLLGEYEHVFASCPTMIKERPLPDQPDRKAKVEVDDIALMTVRMKNGAVGTVEATRLATGAQDELRFEIHGENGALRFNLMDPNWLYAYDCRDVGGDYGGNRGYKQIECVQRYPKPAVFPAPKASLGWLRGHLQSIYEFVVNVVEDRPASPSFVEAAYIQEVMDAAQRSTVSGTWVAVQQPS